VDDEYDHKKRNQFAHHMKEKSEAVSDFAKSKTVKEQREFLPIFSIRQKLMRIIADNQGNFDFVQNNPKTK
jgi:pre-mRNA-splicing factor ATP-dependent RNA helicase DHX38/PRP16